MVLSSRGSWSLFVSETILAVPDRKNPALTPSVNLAFCGLPGGEVIETGVFAVLVHLFEIWITFRLEDLGLVCDPEYLVPVKVLISSPN